MAQSAKGSFELFPWNGGYNASADPISIPSQQLSIGTNCQFDDDGSGRLKRGGIGYLNESVAISVAGVPEDIIWGTDYWANVSNTKRAYHVVISETGKAYRSPYNGIYSSFNSSATATLPAGQGYISSEVFNEDLIIGCGKSIPPKVWDNQNTSTNLVTATATTGTYPSGWIVRSHRNRLWVAGNSSTPDRVYYSGFTAGVPDHRAWNTASSAGFIDIFPGDGDPEGITAIFPEINQGGLYIAKRTKIYYVDTSNPDDSLWSISLVSRGLGCCSHNSAQSVDQSDVIFASDRGIHSLGQVIQQAGIIEAKFLSKDIQNDYQVNLSASDRSQISAVWYPNLNIYAFTASTIAGSFDRIYLMHIITKQWLVWEPASGTTNNFNFLHTRFNSSESTWNMLGCSDNGRILTFNNSVYYDIEGSLATHVPVSMRIKSAFLIPGTNRATESHFTDLAFYTASNSSSSFTVYWNVDNSSQQSKSIKQVITGGNILGETLLGTDFILGETKGLKPYLISINGVGNGIEIEIQHNSAYDFRIYGMTGKYIQSNESYNSARNFGS